MIPIVYQGNGHFEVFSRYHTARVDKLFGKGEIVEVEPVSERSQLSHRHYFACIAEAWRTLPEDMANDFPNPESLRKWALIKAGYCTETKIAFRTNATAISTAAFIGRLDGFAICQVQDRLVTVWRAESQSMRAMKKERFQQSKDDVLGVIAALIGVDPAQLGKAA